MYVCQSPIRDGEQLEAKNGTDIRVAGIKIVRNKYSFVSKRLLIIREAKPGALFKEQSLAFSLKLGKFTGRII